jgi:hypothetical protein
MPEERGRRVAIADIAERRQRPLPHHPRWILAGQLDERGNGRRRLEPTGCAGRRRTNLRIVGVEQSRDLGCRLARTEPAEAFGGVCAVIRIGESRYERRDVCCVMCFSDAQETRVRV